MPATEAVVHTYVTDTGEEKYPVAAAVNLYGGAFGGEDGSGNIRPLVAGDKFLGISRKSYNNVSGLAGALEAEVQREGYFIYDVVGVTDKTANDRPAVYASNDNTLTLTASGNSLVGSVVRWISGSKCVVKFEA